MASLLSNKHLRVHLNSIISSKIHREDSMANQRSEPSAIDENVLAEIKRQLAQIQYGSLEISIHNGQVVQLEKREKKRWEKLDATK